VSAPKKNPLTEEQKAHNKAASPARIAIKHVFAKLKTFNILGAV
jgi:hypothetical protein